MEMGWLLAILAVIGCIYLCVVSPGFRKAVGLIVVCCVGLFFILQQKAEEQNRKDEQKKQADQAKFEIDRAAFWQKEEKRWQVVPASSVELRDTQLKRSWSDSFSVVASVKNNSAKQITGVKFNVVAFDCPVQARSYSECDTVGRAENTSYVEVPAGEVRQLTGSVKLPNVPQSRGNFTWLFTVQGVRAPLSPADSGDDLDRFVYRR